MCELEGLIGLDEYLHEKIEPFVADRLRDVGRHFTCNETWARGTRFGPRTLKAAPLPTTATDYFGYGRRTGAAISVHSHAETSLERYVWRFDEGRPAQQGGDSGRVKLDVLMMVNFGIENGIEKQFRISDSDIRRGALCRADEYRLPDGTTCMRLELYTGTLWFRPYTTDTAASDTLGMMLWRPKSP